MIAGAVWPKRAAPINFDNQKDNQLILIHPEFGVLNDTYWEKFAKVAFLEVAPIRDPGMKNKITIDLAGHSLWAHFRSQPFSAQDLLDSEETLRKIRELQLSGKIWEAGLKDLIKRTFGHDHRFGHDKRTVPMSSLDKSNIQKIVDLLTPLMEREDGRRALLILALGQNAPILRQLDLTGPVELFLVNMIKALVDYGEVAPGKQALWALLEVVRERVGVDRQAKIDTFYPVIDALGRNDDQGRTSENVDLNVDLIEFRLLMIEPNGFQARNVQTWQERANRIEDSSRNAVNNVYQTLFVIWQL